MTKPAAFPDLTPCEVAELAGAPKRAVEKAIEKKWPCPRPPAISTASASEERRARRVLGPESVAYVAPLVTSTAR